MVNVALGLVVTIIAIPIVCCTALEIYDFIIDYR
jgi:hypothetical protein